MRQSYILIAIAAAVGLAAVSDVSAFQGAPGGKFLERLNKARTRARTRKPARPAPTQPSTTAVTPPGTGTSASVPQETRTPRPATGGMPVPSPGTSHPPGGPGTQKYGRITPASSPRTFKTARVTYSMTPRPVGSPSSPQTGDVFLVAQPEDTRVFYYLNGGAQLPQTTTASLRERPAGKISILAYAPALKGRVTAQIPVESGQITTVRFVFPSRASGPALVIPGER